MNYRFAGLQPITFSQTGHMIDQCQFNPQAITKVPQQQNLAGKELAESQLANNLHVFPTRLVVRLEGA
jgi:hypothetical protein